MKRISTLILFAILFFGFSTIISAQQWKDNLPLKKAGTYTLFEYQKAFKDYWAPLNVQGGYYINKKGDKVKASGWKQFKRWEWYWKSRVDNTTGEFPKYSLMDALQDWESKNVTKSAVKSTLGNWQPLGPSNVNSPDFGTGRINCLTFDPNDNNRFWIGAPGGGVWRTDNGGSSWVCLTDDNPVLGVSVIELHPDYDGTTNTTIFIATGDRTVMDNPSVGILKSIDDGATWQTTGFSAAPGEGMTIGGLRIDSLNPNTILVGASSGLYKSTDGGDSWTMKQSGSFIDMEQKPGSNTVYYASTYGWDPKIYKTDDTGDTWTLVREITGHFRAEIAVTDADPNYVYIITSIDAYESGNIELSTNSGDTWNVMFTNSDSNLFGWKTDGSDTGGQGFYDIAIAVSNLDKNEVYIGGVNSHLSTNGGATFNAVTCWSSSTFYNKNGSALIHADHHNAYYHPVTNRLFDVNDGGIHYSDNVTTTNTWTDITGGLANGQIYGIGVSQQTNNETVAGFQDNGTKLLASGTALWDDVKGGDGMHCDIDVTTDEVQYGTYTNLQIDRTANGWGSASSIRGVGGADWAGPLEGDPRDAGVIYIGTDAVERYNGSWSNMSTSLNAITYLLSLEVHNDGTNLVIYTADNSDLWRSNTSGTSFVSVKNNLPSNMVTDIAIDYTNPTTTAWVTLGGYDANNVYMTTDNGASWADISEGLPALPCNTIVQNRQNIAENELYVGTDVGVYVKLGDAPWQLFGEGLPNVVITDLEMYYDVIPANSILRAASYGRGTWESDCYDPPALDASISSIIEPLVEYCELGNFSPTFNLANVGTSTLTSADISYSINGGAPVNIAWTGTLLQGETENVIFSAEVLSYGTHEIVVTVSNPNSGTDENTTNDILTLSYKIWNNSMPYFQNFDDFTNGGNSSSYGGETVALSECWVNEDEGGVDWSVNSGATGSTGTGPSGDHTSGAGTYLYTETSTTGGNIAYVSSPMIDLTNYTGNVMTFWYHMYGLSGGTLWVDLYYDGTWHSGVSVDWDGTEQPANDLGDQGDIWHLATVDISAADGFSDFVGRIRADVTAADYLGDMAFDDFGITGAIACVQPTTSASAMNATPDFNSIDLDWTRGNGSDLLIVVKEGSAVDAGPNFGMTYTANATFGSGTEIGTGNFVVFDGTETSMTLSGLNPDQTYHFAFYEYYDADMCYETTAYVNSATTLTPAPIAEFSGTPLSIIAGNSVDFTDLSSYSPTNWAWTFTGGTPNTSTDQNPTGIVYSSAGTYTVELTATNGTGFNTETKIDYITVSAATIQFADATSTVTEATTTSIECRDYTDIDLTIQVDGTPNADENVTIAIVSGTAVSPADYEIITPMPIVCAAGVSTNKIVTIRIYDDVAIEGIETFDLIITLEGLSDATIGTNSTHTFTIVSDDVAPSSGSSAIILSEDWEIEPVGWYMQNGTGFSNRWSPGTCTIITGTTSASVVEYKQNGTFKDCFYGNYEDAYLYKEVDATGFSGLTVEFNYQAEGDTDVSYGELVYSTDGGTTWILVDATKYQDQSTTVLASVGLPALLDDQIFDLGWKFTAGSSTNSVVGFAIDDIIVTGGAGTTIATSISSTSEYLGPNSTVYYYNATDELMAKIVNTSTHDYGCTQVEIDRTGTSAQEFWTAGVENYLADKTFLVTPTNNNTSGTYDITLYYTDDTGNEIPGWENVTSKVKTALTIAKTGGAVSNITAATPEGNGPGTNYLATVSSNGAFGTNYYVSGSFSSGFSGFGIGDPAPYGIPIVWDGSSSSDWQTTTNWTPEQIPNSADNITVPFGLSNYPIIDAAGSLAVCNDITIDNGASITINPNGQMTVYGTLTNNAGISGLVLQSDDTGDASFIHSTMGINASVQRYLGTGTIPEWHFIASPITNAAVGLFPTDFYYYIESTDDWWTGSTLFGTSGWTVPSGTMTPALGYLNYNTSTTTAIFQGPLNYQASYSMPVSYTEHSGNAGNGEPYTNFDGWALIGNPYTSALNWELIDKTDDITSTVYYYDDVISNYAYYQDGGVSVNSGSKYIPSMQGFFVKSNDNLDGGNIEIPSTARVHDTQSFWKSDKIIEELIKLRMDYNGFSDETVVRFNENATIDFNDQFDAYKRFSWNDEVIQIYTYNQAINTDFAINTVFDDNYIVIPLAYKVNNSDVFTIYPNEFNFDNYSVYLRDLDKNIDTKLSLDQGYTFNSEVGIFKNRFELVFDKSNSDINEFTINDVLIYPNPNKGSFWLTVDNKADNYLVQIHNVTGQIVYMNEFVNSGTKEIKLENQSAGVYFIKVVFDNAYTVNKKVIVQ